MTPSTSPDSPPDPHPWPGGVIGVNSKALRRNTAKRGRAFVRSVGSDPRSGKLKAAAAGSLDVSTSSVASSSAQSPLDVASQPKTPPINNICVKSAQGGVSTVYTRVLLQNNIYVVVFACFLVVCLCDFQSDSDQHDNVCDVCEEVGDLLKCDLCPKVFHLQCLDPPLASVPQDEHWICHGCRKQLRAQQVDEWQNLKTLSAHICL